MDSATHRRVQRLFDPKSGRCVIVPVDDSLIFGPRNGLEDFALKASQISTSEPHAILGFRGHFELHAAELRAPFWICNITASTTRTQHTRKTQVLSVRQALGLGCDAVAVHVNLTSKHEHQMLSILASVVAEAREYAAPIVAIMYPRTEGHDGIDDNYDAARVSDPEYYTELVAHCVRVAKDLGASVIKTQYTGSVETFQTVITAGSPVPIVIAGGPIVSAIESLRMASDAVSAGAAGVSFGRNVFGRQNTADFLLALKEVVCDSVTAEDACLRHRLDER